MNHASSCGEDRLDAVNVELNINREERLNAVRLRQENLLAQQRLKRKLALRERQRRDKKQHAMLEAQKSHHYQTMKGDKKSKSAAIAGMKLMERRLLGKQLLGGDGGDEDKAAFPPFCDLQRMIGERTNVNIETPAMLLKKMFNHTAETSLLDRDLEKLKTKLTLLTKEIPILEMKVDESIASIHSEHYSSENGSENSSDSGNDNDNGDEANEENRSSRSIRTQRRDIEDLQQEYNQKLDNLRHAMNLIIGAVDGIHSIVDEYSTLRDGASSLMKTKQAEQVAEKVSMSMSGEGINTTKSLISMLTHMMSSSVVPTSEAAEAESLCTTSTLHDNDEGKEAEYHRETAEIIQHVQTMFLTLNESVRSVMESLLETPSSILEEEIVGEKKKKSNQISKCMDTPKNLLAMVTATAVVVAGETAETAEAAETAETVAAEEKAETTAPVMLCLSKSTESLLSDNNVRVKSIKFRKELSRGEKKRLTTVSRVKTLRESRLASATRPTNLLLSAIHGLLQKEQDLLHLTGTGSLIKEVDGQIVISSIDQFTYEMDECGDDSEDDDMNESRAEMKIQIKKSMRERKRSESRSGTPVQKNEG